MNLGDLNVTSVIGGVAGIGLLTTFIASFWSQLRGYLHRLVGLIFASSIISGNTMREASLIYLVKNYKCLNISERLFWGTLEYVRPNQRNELIGMGLPPNSSSFWYRNRSIISVEVAEDMLKIGHIRGTFNPEKFVESAIDYHNKTKKNKDWKTGYDRYRIITFSGSIGKNKDSMARDNGAPSVAENVTKSEHTGFTEAYRSIINNQESRYDIFKPIKWTKDQLGQPKRNSPVDLLSLKQNVLDAVEEAIRWRSSEEWFVQRNIAHKRGFVLYGAAGTGKTAFVRALGQELNMPISTFDLATMTNQDFTRCWEQAMAGTPCIVLIEDIDAVFDGRKNIATQGMNQGLSFDCLLNTVDGVQNTDGMFLIITTNNIEKLDPALGNPMANGNGLASMSTRPGRIDRAIKFEPLDEDGRIKMAKRIFEDVQEEKWKYLLSEGNNDTGAQFQERCCRLALKLFWEK